MSNKWKGIGIFSILTSTVPLGLGFYKMFIYESGDSWAKDPVNAYVGGDAYNYIINANYAIGYFVLGGILILIAIGCGIMYYLSRIADAAE